jgi:hypothetical protein
MNPVESMNHLPDLHDLIVSMRDLRKEDPKRELDGEETREWLRDCVVCECLERSGCVRCAEFEYEAQHREDEADDEEGDEDDSEESKGEKEPESEDDRIFGEQAA